MSRRDRLRRYRWAIGAAIAVLTGLAITGLASWHFSSFVLVPDHDPWSDPVDVEAVGAHRITLSASEAASRPGYYGLAWDSGHAIIGPVLTEGGGTVTRQLSEVSGYLAPGTEGAGMESEVYAGNPRSARRLPFRSVDVEGELGAMPAWLVPPPAPSDAGTWAIVVHGINADPQTGLRITPTLRRVGLTTLMVTYRDDLGAPSSPDGLHHQGLTEWHDLQAAARYALARGADRLVLVGYSMGGAIVAQFMQRSSLSNRVDALVLDAPVLDWKAVLEFNAERMGLPGLFALPVEWAIDLRIDADWDSLDALEHTEDFHLPILLFHGRDDDVVPTATSEQFAAELPRWVHYHPVAEAGHTQSWNVDPTLYERRLNSFLITALQAKRARPNRSGSKRKEPAVTYSPRRLPSKYHRR